MLLAWLRSRVPSLFALYGAIGGGIGFGVGASLQPLGRAVWAGMPLGWWKAMELTFGGLLGLAYVLCAWRLRISLLAPHRPPLRAIRLPAVALAERAPTRVSRSDPRDWARNRGGPACARPLRLHDRRSRACEPRALFRIARLADRHHRDRRGLRVDFLDYQTFAPLPLAWTILVATTAAVAVLVARYPRTRAMLLLLTWAAVVSSFRYLFPPSSGTRGGDDAHGLRCPRADPEPHAPCCAGTRGAANRRNVGRVADCSGGGFAARQTGAAEDRTASRRERTSPVISSMPMLFRHRLSLQGDRRWLSGPMHGLQEYPVWITSELVDSGR